ncbi:MAG: cytochrome ubiquinol oxidase subunit I [Actinomycetota bacterium]|jgi:cytochrome d ubiquinol oxidase subunit I|nr:cytochrome ubiquinol oxidase subunit I [Actinomycetota bacterium]
MIVAVSSARLATNRAFASAQMGFSLGWHIVLASFGVGFPILVLYAEWKARRSGDPLYLLLARRWAKVMGVLFAVGAVSGTILSFELGILWPGLMSRFGAIFGFPFTLEGFAFFIEAIFLGIYLYGWDRLTPRAHLLTGVPVALAGMASAWFVVTANSWMNDPTGFRLVGGRVTHVDPWAGIFNPATPTETTHMILAAYMVTGFGVAAVYAAAILRGKRDRYHRTGLRIGLTMGAVLAPVQGIVGDFSARYVASHQPIKLAAMEGVFHTAKGVPETLGGLDIAGKMRFAVHIPDGLSLLTHLNPHAEITGLDTVPADQRPPVNPVHLSFDLMVGIGFLLLFLALWAGWSWWRHRALPERRSFLLVALAAGPLATVALEAGWVTTEVGRQPWIVYHVMRVDQAVNTAPGLWVGLPVLVAIYGVLTAVLVVVLRRLAAVPLPLDEPTETDAVAVKVI